MKEIIIQRRSYLEHDIEAIKDTTLRCNIEEAKWLGNMALGGRAH